ncbi:PEP-CTERM sorting domain-containing protein [Thalassomonas haliotis]|uniref:PEP-CTERM sorting domain-containing protein n=1 Tax=Thalassomonas haliotis TaxID=485448 RepID=A0ABY7VE60_9GAMM|nr:PEP-CTERM sorting domain-containing protein [Thalassomonas haliotis]WDE11973.1 PEP-CTERM sorting domain-containing protein [Thalassomonas haliotis]
MKNKLNLFLSAVLFLITTQVNATIIETISFLGENQGVAESFEFASADVGLTVTAWTTNVNDEQTELAPWQILSGDYGVYNGSTGLGLVSSEHDGYDLDGGSSGNFADDPDEGLLFVFSEQVNLHAFTVGDLSSNDDVNFSWVNLLPSDSLEATNLFVDRNDGSDNYQLSSGTLGYAFMLWVDGNDDDVRIESLEFSTVPEPYTLLLLAIGLLLCGYRGMKKGR